MGHLEQFQELLTSSKNRVTLVTYRRVFLRDLRPSRGSKKYQSRVSSTRRRPKNRQSPGRRRLCVNPGCQVATPPGQVQNEFYKLEDPIPEDLRCKASITPGATLIRCLTCQNISEGRINAEGDPIPRRHTRLFWDANAGAVKYVPLQEGLV